VHVKTTRIAATNDKPCFDLLADSQHEMPVGHGAARDNQALGHHATSKRTVYVYRATADSDEGVPLGGLSKLGSNVADLMTSFERPSLQRPSASMDRLAAMLGSSSTGQLLTPASTNAKTSPESLTGSPAQDGSETTLAPADVRLTVSPRRRGGSPLQKGGSLAMLSEIAKSEGSVTSSAGLLPSGGLTSSPTAQARYLTLSLWPVSPQYMSGIAFSWLFLLGRV